MSGAPQPPTSTILSLPLASIGLLQLAGLRKVQPPAHWLHTLLSGSYRSLGRGSFRVSMPTDPGTGCESSASSNHAALTPLPVRSVGWYVSLRTQDDDGNWTHNCGGMLVTQTTVLTAAHVRTTGGGMFCKMAEAPLRRERGLQRIRALGWFACSDTTRSACPHHRQPRNHIIPRGLRR